MERWEIVVVGAGASGLMAARAAARARRARGIQGGVLILEGNPKPGKKLLATGNGRCNLTNLNAVPDHYHGDRELAAPLLKEYTPAAILEEFREMGLLCRPDSEGRVYPRNLQAAAVLQALRWSCEELGVTLRCGQGVSAVAPAAGGFRLELMEGEPLFAAQVIVACGGKASPKHSWEGGGYELAEKLGHRVIARYPSLTSLKSSKKCLRSLKGMRAKAKAALVKEGKRLWEESGEVMFGETALSGICVFDLSARLEGAIQGDFWVSLDLLEDMPYGEVLAYLEDVARSHPSRPAWELFSGMLNLRVGEALMKELAVPRESTLGALTRQQLRKAASLCKDWRFPITGRGDWEGAQVTKGGVPLSEVDCLTLESKKHRGLYLVGELLNIDGDCGGYNLHWAWATGLAAGQAAGKRKGKRPC
ncbi:MAG: NAD(P)/FAD-dependent oxidoreductase [Acutalibacter sp.]